jgi:hypothetical protein
LDLKHPFLNDVKKASFCRVLSLAPPISFLCLFLSCFLAHLFQMPKKPTHYELRRLKNDRPGSPLSDVGVASSTSDPTNEINVVAAETEAVTVRRGAGDAGAAARKPLPKYLDDDVAALDNGGAAAGKRTKERRSLGVVPAPEGELCFSILCVCVFSAC